MAEIEGILVPRRTFIVREGGRYVRFQKGRTTIVAGHPLLKGREDAFRPLTVDHDIEARPRPTTSSRTRSAPPARHAAPPRSAPPAGLAAFTALKARARELGLPGKGKTAELEAAIAAEEQRRADETPGLSTSDLGT